MPTNYWSLFYAGAVSGILDAIRFKRRSNTRRTTITSESREQVLSITIRATSKGRTCISPSERFCQSSKEKVMEASDSSRIESASYVTLRCHTARMVSGLATATSNIQACHCSDSVVPFARRTTFPLSKSN